MKEIIDKYHRPLIWSLLIFQLLLFAINIPGLYVDFDDAWLGEQAIMFARDGLVSSEMFQDYLRYNERILVYHKAFIWTGGLFIKLFGLSLYSLRLVSILFGLLLAGLIHLFCKKYYNSTIFRLTIIILLSCPLIFHYSAIFRPEVMLATFGFGSFFLLYEYLKQNKMIFLILSAIVAGLSVLVHLNGLIFIGAGAALLLFNKRWSGLVSFSILSAIIASLYFYEAIGNMELFRLQFVGDPSNAGSNLQWYMPFKNLINEHKRLFRKPEIYGITILFLLSVFYQIKSKTLKDRSMLVYAFSLIVLLGIISQNKTTKFYGIMLFPYFALIMAQNIYLLLTESERLKSYLQKLFIVMLTLVIGYGLFFSFQVILTGKEDWVSRHRAVASHIKQNSRVLVPMNFIFNEIDNYEILALNLARMTISDRGGEFDKETLCDLADEFNIEYIVIDEKYRTLLNCQPGDTACLEHNQFKYLSSEYEFDIYRRDRSLIE